jgi:hypothetical protein
MAFYGCVSLESVMFTSKITSIGSSAFFECKALKSIEIPETVTEIDVQAFGCTALEHVTLPQGMTELSRYIFSECNSLKTLTIPKSVKKINDGALYDCPKLNDIYYDGTKAEWDKIEKINLIGVTVVHCTDGDVQLEWKTDK